MARTECGAKNGRATDGGTGSGPLFNQRGMALLVTVAILGLLVALTLQYHKNTWLRYVVSFNHKTDIQLKMIAGSAVQVGMALLQHDKSSNTTDSFLDGWATTSNEDFEGFFPSAGMHLEIVDLSGRMQINSIVKKKSGSRGVEQEARAVLQRLLLSGAFTISGEENVRQLMDAIVDWIDPDDRESDYGAESSYYRSLDPPYSCSNGPVEYLEELLLVKGMTPELLFGTSKTRGLADYLTVYGDDGRININTAPRLLLKSLDPLISDELVDRLDAFRRNASNRAKLGDPTWYKNIGGWPGDIMLYEEMLTTESSYFQIKGTGQVENLAKKVFAVVERAGRKPFRLLWTKVE